MAILLALMLTALAEQLPAVGQTPAGDHVRATRAVLQRVIERNADRLRERCRDATDRALARRDWPAFAVNLRIYALWRIHEARAALPAFVAAARPPSPLAGLVPDARDADLPDVLAPLFAAVPAVRPAARRSPMLRATLVSLMAPPPGTRGLRISPARPPSSNADHGVDGDGEVFVRYAAKLSGSTSSECWTCRTVVFELCNPRSTPAFVALDRAALWREVTAGQYVRGIDLLERIADFETWLALANVIDAEGRPPCDDVRVWWVGVDRPKLNDGYPWRFYGPRYENLWVQRWSRDREGTPMWPVWVALHRLPNYTLYNEDLDGYWKLTKEWVFYIRSQAVKNPLYAVLDAMPEPWARRFYMTPGVEWLDDPGRLVEALR